MTKKPETERLPPDQLLDAVRVEGERAGVDPKDARDEAKKPRESALVGRKTRDAQGVAPHPQPPKRRT